MNCLVLRRMTVISAIVPPLIFDAYWVKGAGVGGAMSFYIAAPN